jgi:hypothetical protein
MAALPCALATRALCDGRAPRCGALTAPELLGPAPMLDEMTACGFELRVGAG